MSTEDYNEKSIDATVARIEEKVDSLLAVRLDHEKRIGALEKFQWKAIGIITAVMFALQYFKK